MNHLSLFSGIGGMDLGFERAGHTLIGQVEKDPSRVDRLRALGNAVVPQVAYYIAMMLDS